jgi:hypothetical protein
VIDRPYQEPTPCRSPAAPGERWRAVNQALAQGLRGLPGGDSLARLLARRFGVRSHLSAPDLTVQQILAWADAFRRRTGDWPRVASGPIPEAPDETWLRVDTALRAGLRGLKCGSSLPQLLAEHRGARNKARTPPLTVEQILRWADEHHRRTGEWPRQYSGPVFGAEGEMWSAIQASLRAGMRGLPGGDSIHELLLRTGRKESAARKGTGQAEPAG